MEHIDFYIRLQVAIIGVGLPILLQVVSRLDNKYDSASILNLFQKEWSLKMFIAAVISSLIATIIWTFQFEPFFQTDLEWLNAIINSSANILLIGLCIVLVISFLRIFQVVYLYYTYENLTPHLVDSKKEENLKNQALKDIFLQLMSAKGKEKLLESVKEYFDNLISSQKSVGSDKELFSSSVIDLIIKTSEVQNRLVEKVTKYGSTNLASIWLNADLKQHSVSELEYRLIWTICSDSIHKGNADLYMDHWKRSDQMISNVDTEIMSLRSNDKDDQANELEKRKSKFVRFHYSIGGLILYKYEYPFIRRMFEHTRSSGDMFSFSMLPKNMSEVFEFYALTRVYSPLDYDETFRYYRFPGTDGLRSEAISIKWISKYAALLFLRQFTISSSTYGYKPVSIPRLPRDQRKAQVWLEGMHFFKSLVSEQLENTELIQAVGFNKYSKIIDKEGVYNFLKELEVSFDDEFERMKKEESLDDEKLKQFQKRSIEIIDHGLDEIFSVLNTVESEEDIEGENTLSGDTKFKLSKDAFIKNSLIHNTNFDSFAASSALKRIQENVQNEFYTHKTIQYDIDEKQIKEALIRLSLSQDHVILNYGLNLDYFLWDPDTREMDVRFQELDIRELRSQDNRMKGLYILRKIDLPMISSEDLEDDEKNELKTLSDKYLSYWNIHLPEKPQYDRYKELVVDVEVFLRVGIKWKSDLKMLYIKSIKDYDLTGEETKLSDIEEF